MFDDLMRIYSKVDWEGGLYEAAYGYGIHAEDINPEKLPELHAAWKAMDEAHNVHFAPAFKKVQQLLETGDNGENI